nr:MAG TPA: hypothetical protein [Caudoviricetes sp.]
MTRFFQPIDGNFIYGLAPRNLWAAQRCAKFAPE